MSASFCDCVNQWEKAVGLQELKDTKILSVRTRGVIWMIVHSSMYNVCTILCHRWFNKLSMYTNSSVHKIDGIRHSSPPQSHRGKQT